jgi:hypothetical protein
MARGKNEEAVSVGETVTLPSGATQTVSASCGANGGVWGCSTHRRLFPNNLNASSHAMEGSHVVYWMCDEHGPEQP